MAGQKVVPLPDRLRIEGVLHAGFGIICKFPMTDTELSVGAKAVYAMICAYAGNDSSAFPSREKFLHHLQIGKNKFYESLKQLTDQGYIRIESTKAQNGQFSHNVYTIVSNPKKFAEQEYSSDGGTLTRAFGYSGIKGAGYGVLPRAVIIDDRLSIGAKVLYAYLASFTGGGKTAFPKTEHIQYHLQISKNSYQRYMQMLIKHNYITSVQQHVDGRLSVNNYYLNDKPDEASVLSIQERRRQSKVLIRTEQQITQTEDTVTQIPQNRDMAQSVAAKPPAIGEREQIPQNKDTAAQIPHYEDPAHQYTAIQYTAPGDITKNSFSKNSSLITSPSIQQPQPQWHWMDGMSMREVIDTILCDNLIYESRDQHHVPILDSDINYIIETIAEFICSKQPTLRVRGVIHDRVEVIEKLLLLNVDDYAYVQQKINKVSSEIKNLRKYYLVCLYSAREDQDAEIMHEIERDSQRYG